MSPDTNPEIKTNPMNFLRKLLEPNSMRSDLNAPKSSQGITKKEIVDLLLFMLICFMIVIYKVNKA